MTLGLKAMEGIVKNSPSQNQLRGMTVEQIEPLLVEFADDQEFLERVRRRCRGGNTRAAAKLEREVERRLAIIGVTDAVRSRKSNWGFRAVVIAVAGAIGVGILQAFGHEIWRSTGPVLRKLVGI